MKHMLSTSCLLAGLMVVSAGHAKTVVSGKSDDERVVQGVSGNSASSTEPAQAGRNPSASQPDDEKSDNDNMPSRAGSNPDGTRTQQPQHPPPPPHHDPN